MSIFNQSLALLLILLMNNAWGQEDESDLPRVDPEEFLNTDLVTYPVGYFDRFNPISALDIVRQVPGFQFEDNAFTHDVRGFGGGSGNVLIDDRRPSAKQDNLSAILERIPAESVARLELIRGQVRNIDLRGQSAVVNVILKEGTPATIQWKAAIRKTFQHGPLEPEGSVSLANNWNGIDYNIGLKANTFTFGRLGDERFFDENGTLDERRVEDRYNKITFVLANLNLAGWLGETFMQLNGIFDYQKWKTENEVDRFIQVPNVQRKFLFEDPQDIPFYELGFDMERSLLPSLTAKGIVLFVTGTEEFSSRQVNIDENGQQTLDRLAVGEKDEQELITRVEFDWTPLDGHLVQANFERAVNTLDNSLIQTDDTGAGPVEVDVPGANSKIEEERWDLLVKDTWILGNIELDYGIGAETSTLTQTGDSELERDFFFLKPQANLTYNWATNDQSRVSLFREVAQLDLEDFVSATEFIDNDVALGNPNIKPDATWKLEMSHEKRFGEGVVKVTLFHDWISDVLDLLPITDVFEAPGNIGNGRRWGTRLEGTLPLEWIGLTGAKLNFNARIQDSSVTDPVTGEKRVLSIALPSTGMMNVDIENSYAYQLEYRQDFQALQVAWGWRLSERGNQYQYKVNELVVFDEGTEINAFIETTRWFGIKTRLDVENSTNDHLIRNRTIYTGRRELSPLEALHFRNRTRGIRMALRFSGNF